MNLNKKRGFLQISFAWLFGIIAGAIILALAIFMVAKLMNVGQMQTGAEAQKQISVLLNPLETGVQSGEVTTLSISPTTRIYNTCDSQSGTFGKQILSVSQESFGKWSAPTPGISAQNRYIFSGSYTEGKTFLLFSKPFDFPFAVANLIYMTSASTNYCFVNSPAEIEEELSNLKQPNIILDTAGDGSSCPKDSTRICFNSHTQNCENSDIIVDYSGGEGTVQKNNTEMSFSTNALMYAAIFSNKEIYDCQLKRLMERESELAKIYQEKANILQSTGCSIGFISDLHALENQAGSFSSESDLNTVSTLSSNLQTENEISQCLLW